VTLLELLTVVAFGLAVSSWLGALIVHGATVRGSEVARWRRRIQGRWYLYPLLGAVPVAAMLGVGYLLYLADQVKL
jgi:anti-sigma factor RsiW